MFIHLLIPLRSHLKECLNQQIKLHWVSMFNIRGVDQRCKILRQVLLTLHKLESTKIGQELINMRNIIIVKMVQVEITMTLELSKEAQI